MIRLRLPLYVIASTLAGTAAAQTVTWGGGFPNDKYSVASNWAGGAVPLGNGTETLQFDDESDSTLKVNTAGVAFLGIGIPADTEGNGTTPDIIGTNSLTIGTGGIVINDNNETEDSLTFDVPLVLTANQTWSQFQNQNGFLQVNGAISGSYGLVLQGDTEFETYVLTSGSSTFTGGVHVEARNTALFVATSSTGPSGAPTSGPVGTGTLALDDGTTLSTTGGGPVTLANSLTLGDQSSSASVTFGGPSIQYIFGNSPTRLILSGPVLLNDFDLDLDIAPNSAVGFSGSLTGYTPGVCLDFGSSGSFAGTSYAIVQGAIANVDRIDLEDSVSVIFNGTYSAQVANLGDFGIGSSNYLGFGSGYAGEGQMTDVINFLNATSVANFAGTLGFDSVTGTGPTSVFNDPINLVHFTNEDFVGLGSATRAILGPGATINPPFDTYLFGGGGGTLTVQSSLADGENSYNLILAAGNAPLTLVLTNSQGGSLSYTGTTTVSGAALLFDTPLPPGAIYLNHGYVGVTPTAGFTNTNGNIQLWLNRFVGEDPTGVIGFDTLSGPLTIYSPIDLSALNSSVYLGSATSVTYQGDITPYGTNYQFSGVKGGQVNVSAVLADNGSPYSVIVGLPSPIESFNPVTGTTSSSTVTLSGDNSYTGGTTLNSGTLLVTGPNSIGTGPLTVSGPASLGASGGPVMLANAINLPNRGLTLNNGSSNLLTLTGNIADDFEDPGSLQIFGPVTLSGNNSYSGSTLVANTTLTVASDSGVGTSFVGAQNSTLHFTSASPQVYGGMNLSNSTATFDGNPVLAEVQLQESTLNFNGALAVINGLEGDSLNSNNVINLGATTQLTINDSEEDGGSYHGIIAGSAGSSVDYTGTNSLNLSGANTYGGGTTIGTGVVIIASADSAFGTGPVNVSTGSAIATNTGVTLTNQISLADGSGLAGYGTYSPATPQNFTFRNGSIIDPGSALINSGNDSNRVPVPGMITIGGGSSLTFASGGTYVFSISDANGTSGVGYSTVDLGAGSLAIQSTTSNPFNIDLFSFDPSTNLAGMANNFNPALPYSWTLVSAASITGFNPGDFTLTLADFQNPIGAGSFFVAQSGGDLMLNFTPVPEPSTWALMASGLCALGAAVRRRRR